MSVDAQFIEPCQHALLGIPLGLLEPGDEVPAHFGHELRVVTTSDQRRPQTACQVQLDAALTQLGEQFRVDKVVGNTEAAFGELIDHARRRDRSPRRFASGRILRPFFLGLRRLPACLAAFFFGAASSMEPRHFGDPQRQA